MSERVSRTWKLGDEHRGFFVTNIREDGILDFHAPCEQCGHRLGNRVSWRPDEVGSRTLIGSSGHDCIKHLNERLSMLEMAISKLTRGGNDV